jgi:hypothetical protein
MVFKDLILKFDSEEQSIPILFDVYPAQKELREVTLRHPVYDNDGNELASGEFEQQEVEVAPERRIARFPDLIVMGGRSEPTGETHMVTLGPGYEVEAPVFRRLPGYFVQVRVSDTDNIDIIKPYIENEIPRMDIEPSKIGRQE